MIEFDDDNIHIHFQWVVGDTRVLEKQYQILTRVRYPYVTTLLSRLIAFAATYVVVSWLIPRTEVLTVLLISLAGSYALWVSWAWSLFSFRALEKRKALEAFKVGSQWVRINKFGITWSNETGYEYQSWFAISDVEFRNNSVWIKTGDSGGFYLPPRLFESSDVDEQFKQRIASYRAEPGNPIHMKEFDQSEAVRH